MTKNSDVYKTVHVWLKCQTFLTPSTGNQWSLLLGCDQTENHISPQDVSGPDSEGHSDERTNGSRDPIIWPINLSEPAAHWGDEFIRFAPVALHSYLLTSNPWHTVWVMSMFFHSGAELHVLSFFIMFELTSVMV